MNTMETMELTPDLFEPLDSAEKNSEFIAAEPRTYLSDAWRRISGRTSSPSAAWSFWYSW